MFSKLSAAGYMHTALYAHRIESYIKLGLLAILATSFIVACGNKGVGNGAVGGVSILSVTSGGVGTGYGGVTSLTISVADGSGQPAQNYILNVGVGAINGDLRQIGQNVYELQATCANANCSDVAFLIVARRGFANTTGTFNSYFGSNPLAGNGINYPASASTQYVLTTQPMGSVEFLYRATGNGSAGITWVLTKTLVDNTGQVNILNQTQILALEQP